MLKRCTSPAVVFYAVMALTVASHGHATSSPVQVGKFTTTEQAQQLVGDFPIILKTVIETNKSSIKELEQANTKMSECDAHLGQQTLDEARYSACNVTAAQTTRTAYKNIQVGMQRLQGEIARYELRRKREQQKQSSALKQEQSRLKEDEAALVQLRNKMEQVMRSLKANDPNAPLTPEQEMLVEEITEEYAHQQSLREIHAHGVQVAEQGLDQSRKIEKIMTRFSHKAGLLVKRAGNRQHQSSEYIRVVRQSGVNRAWEIEADKAIDILAGSFPLLEQIMQGSKMPLQMVHGSSGSVWNLQSGTTAGEALAVMRTLLEKGGAQHE